MNRFKLGAIGAIIWILGILVEFSSVYVILQTNVYALVLAISYVVYGLGVILISLAVLEFSNIPYPELLKLFESLKTTRALHGLDTLVLAQHDNVFTIGRHADASHRSSVLSVGQQHNIPG